MKRYALIGGSTGIGRALVDILTAEGSSIEVYSRSTSDLDNVLSVTHHEFDVLESDFSELKEGEELDGLVYCPGTIALKPFKGFKEEQFLHDFQVNALGAAKSTQAVLKRLKPGASIVYFSTVAVQRGMPFHASIAMAKGAIEGLTRTLASEMAPKARVNCIAPSLTDTPLAANLLSNEKKQEAAQERHPLKRYASAQDVAEMAAFLLSDKSLSITGQVIGVDGGLSAI